MKQLIIIVVVLIILTNIVSLPSLNKLGLLSSEVELLVLNKSFCLISKILLPGAIGLFLAPKDLGDKYDIFKTCRNREQVRIQSFNK